MCALDVDSSLLLDLLREAGDEAVTYDELEVAGVREPALALFELEEAGHAVSRVFDMTDHGRLVTCVRLGAEPAPIEIVSRGPVPAPKPSRAPLVAGLLLTFLLALVVSR